MRISHLVTGATTLMGMVQPTGAGPVRVAERLRRATLPLPAEDPFYTPPTGYEDTEPGTVLRSRTIEVSFFSDIPDLVEGWQLLYRTTAVNGTAISTVTTIFKPLLAYTDRFVSYATAYDSSATKCDPSYAYELGSDAFDNLGTDAEFLLIEGLLLQGYIVSSANYEGPDAAFSPGHLEGMCLLDSLRAVSNFGSTLGLSTDSPDIVASGYSGGAIATGWAASLQSSYAPELPVKGWVYGGTPVNLTGVVTYLDNTTWSGFLPAAVVGLSAPSAYEAQLQSLLDEILTDEGREAFEYSKSHCTLGDISEYAFTSILSYEFQTLGPAILQQPALSQVLTDNIMGLYGNLTPTAPVLMYHAEQDEIIPYSNASALVDRYCSRGVDITFTTYEEGGHVTTAVVGIPELYTFVNEAFSGTLETGCNKKTELGGTLSVVGLAVELEPILAKLIDYLHDLSSGT
ncbi:secretory lipase-domain-containing protein [Xylariaceae sp. FL0804]|nr:secretory lipase-domain-containing protein [Xylariaceae sp. FL0804]